MQSNFSTPIFPRGTQHLLSLSVFPDAPCLHFPPHVVPSKQCVQTLLKGVIKSCQARKENKFFDTLFQLRMRQSEGRKRETACCLPSVSPRRGSLRRRLVVVFSDSAPLFSPKAAHLIPNKSLAALSSRRGRRRNWEKNQTAQAVHLRLSGPSESF